MEIIYKNNDYEKKIIELGTIIGLFEIPYKEDKIIKMSSNGCDSIKSTFDELERNGYLVRTDSLDSGRYFKIDYTFFERSIILNRVDSKIKNA